MALFAGHGCAHPANSNPAGGTLSGAKSLSAVQTGFPALPPSEVGLSVGCQAQQVPALASAFGGLQPRDEPGVEHPPRSPVTGRGQRSARTVAQGPSRLTNSHTGCFSGCLEDHALPDLDGMVGKAFIKPAQEGDINSGRNAVRPVLLPEQGV